MSRHLTQSNVSENESTPLLPAIVKKKEEMKSTPLPVKSIIVLGIMRCSEPIALSCIFPFINQVSSFHTYLLPPSFKNNP